MFDPLPEPPPQPSPIPSAGKQVRLARVVAWLLRRLVILKTEAVSGLSLIIEAGRNRELLQGRVSRLEMSFERIEFGQLLVSGGGRLVITDLDLRMRNLLFHDRQFLRQPYSLSGDFLLTQADIVNSRFIRNMLQLLIDTVMQRAITSTLEVGLEVGSGLDKLTSSLDAGLQLLGLGGTVSDTIGSIERAISGMGLSVIGTGGQGMRTIDRRLLQRLVSGLEMKITKVQIAERKIVVTGEYTAPLVAPLGDGAGGAEGTRVEAGSRPAGSASAGDEGTDSSDSDGEFATRSASASASALFGADSIRFEVSLSLGTRSKGQVVYIRDIIFTGVHFGNIIISRARLSAFVVSSSLFPPSPPPPLRLRVVNPDNALRTSLPLFLQTPIDVDLGNDLSLSSLVITDKHVRVRADAVISPFVSEQDEGQIVGEGEELQALDPPPRRAMYRFDLAQLLSQVMSLKGGLFPKLAGYNSLDELLGLQRRET